MIVFGSLRFAEEYFDKVYYMHFMIWIFTLAIHMSRNVSSTYWRSKYHGDYERGLSL